MLISAYGVVWCLEECIMPILVLEHGNTDDGVEYCTGVVCLRLCVVWCVVRIRVIIHLGVGVAMLGVQCLPTACWIDGSW